MQPWMERKDMDMVCPFMVVNAWVKTHMHADIPAVMNPRVKVNLEFQLMHVHSSLQVQSPLDMRDMDINIHLHVEMDMSMVTWVINIVANLMVKPEVVHSMDTEVARSIRMDEGLSMVMNPWNMSH